MTQSALPVRKRAPAAGLSRILLLLCLLLVFWPTGFQSSVVAANGSDDEEETGQSETNDNDDNDDDDDDNDAVQTSAPEGGRTRSGVSYNARSSVVTTSKRSVDAEDPSEGKRKRSRYVEPDDSFEEEEQATATPATITSASTTSAPAISATRRSRASASFPAQLSSLVETRQESPARVRFSDQYSVHVAPLVGPELMLEITGPSGTRSLVELPPLDVNVRQTPDTRPQLNYFVREEDGRRDTIFKEERKNKPVQELMGRVSVVRNDGTVTDIPKTSHVTDDTAFYPLSRYVKIKDSLSSSDRARARGLESRFVNRWVMSFQKTDRDQASQLFTTAEIHTEQIFIDVVSPEIVRYFNSLEDANDIQYLVFDINQHLTACTGCFNNIVGVNEGVKWPDSARSWLTILSDDRLGGEIEHDVRHIKVVVRLDAYSAEWLPRSSYFPAGSYYTEDLTRVISPRLRESAVVFSLPVANRHDPEKEVSKAIRRMHENSSSTTSTSTSSTRRPLPR